MGSIANRRELPAAHVRPAEVRAQKMAVRRVKRELFGFDRTPKGRYTREFEREFQHIEGPATNEEILEACLASDIVYVGDYHALPQAQEYEAALIRELARHSDRLVVGLEMIYRRDQNNLDRWLQGRISEREFLRRIRYNLEWGYDWENFRVIFEACKAHGIPIHGIDTDPRLGLRRIRERDEAVAHNLHELRESYPDHKIVVVFGESHLASNHLPGNFERIHPAGKPRPRTVTILQNLDDIYFKTVSSGLEDVEAVRLREDAYCVFNSIPLVKYQCYRAMLERWSNADSDVDARGRAAVVADLIDCLLDFLGINKYTTKVLSRGFEESLYEAYPDLHMGLAADEIRRVMALKNVIPQHRSEIVRHIQSSSCCYIREMNAIFIQRWDFNRITEVVSRFVNVALKRQHHSSFLRTHRKLDRFFVKVMEEALAYFGSKVINHNRPFVKEQEFIERRATAFTKVAQMYKLKKQTVLRLHRVYLKLIEFHSGATARRRPPLWLSRLLRSGGKVRGALSDLSGHFLGERIHQDYHDGRLTIPSLRKLFSMTFTDRPAYQTYLMVLRRSWE